MCIDMCMDICVDMCMDICTDICIDMCTDMCIDMCIDICIDMCVDMCTDMSTDMCVEITDRSSKKYMTCRLWASLCRHMPCPDMSSPSSLPHSTSLHLSNLVKPSRV